MDSGVTEEYRQFLSRFRGEYIYELLRLSVEVTPFKTLHHIAGVHHVAMTVSRAFKAGGGLIDLGLISGAALGHDIGKFGCKSGERVPYLHYYYTDQWFTQRGLSALGHIARQPLRLGSGNRKPVLRVPGPGVRRLPGEADLRRPAS